jgi:hypothetical protein
MKSRQSAAEKYLVMLKRWDSIAADQKITAWPEQVGCAVENYLIECVAHGTIPTFLGFWLVLCQIAPREVHHDETRA